MTVTTSSAQGELPFSIVIQHPDLKQRTMLDSAMAQGGAEVQSVAQRSELISLTLPLGGVWVLFDEGEGTRDVIDHLRTHKQQAFWGILALGQAPASQQQVLIQAGADAYLTYPFDLSGLRSQLRQIVEKRTPVGAFGILPPQIAAGLDRVWARFDQLSYYDLLELPPIASDDDIQARFHQRSLVLHPDRHRGLKQSHPAIYRRVNLIYKRLLEGYRVLTHSLQRPLYDAALVSGVTRWGYQLEERRKEIIAASDLTESQIALAQALKMRSRGLLTVAYRLILNTCQREPSNALIRQMADGYQKLVELARRDPEIAYILDEQRPPEEMQ